MSDKNYKEITKAATPIVAMVLVTVLIVTALFLGYDGTLLATAVAVIAGIAGYTGKMALDTAKS